MALVTFSFGSVFGIVMVRMRPRPWQFKQGFELRSVAPHGSYPEQIHRFARDDGGMPYCCLKIRLKWVRLSESKSKLACIWPNMSIFAVFRRQRYDDSVKPAFLFSSAFLPISFIISFNDAEANLNCYFTTR